MGHADRLVMRSLALGFVIVLSALTNVKAVQRVGLLQQLVGVWHLTGIDHPEHDEQHLYVLELEFTPSGFRSYYRVDLEDPSVCEGTVELTAEGWLRFDTVDPDDYCDIFESFAFGTAFDRAVLSGQTLELHTDDQSPDGMVLRFQRGRVRRLGAPPRPLCVDGTLPSPTRQQGPSFFAFDHKLWFPNELVLSPSERRAAEAVRRRWLRRAVDAFEGRADGVLLKFDFPTWEGAIIETFLDIRHGSADLTYWDEPPMVGDQERPLLRCPISQMLLVEPVNSMLLVPIRTRLSSERARLLLRLDSEQSERLGVFPYPY